MATTIRLARHGAKKHPFYRIIVTDSRAPRDGRRLDQVGTYDPSQNPPRAEFNQERLAQWLRRGARPSLTVTQLMQRCGVGATAPGAAEGAQTGLDAPPSGEGET